MSFKREIFKIWLKVLMITELRPDFSGVFLFAAAKKAGTEGGNLAPI